jgi:hypothetical protein
MQKTIGKATRANAEDLKQVSLGTVDSFHKDPKFESEKDGAVKATQLSDKDAKAFTGEEMLSKATQDFATGTNGD